jgi:hypothetical protein
MHATGTGTRGLSSKAAMQRRAARLTGSQGNQGKKQWRAAAGDTIQQNNIKQKWEANFDNKKHDNGGVSKDQNKLNLKHNESLLFKPIRETSKILEGHLPQTTRGTLREEQQIGTLTPTKKAIRDGRALPRKLLNNGQGKCGVSLVMNEESGSDMEISAESLAEAAMTDVTEATFSAN